MGKQRITLSGNGRTLVLNNPVLTASGTFGYGLEYTPFGNLASLGGIVEDRLAAFRGMDDRVARGKVALDLADPKRFEPWI